MTEINKKLRSGLLPAPMIIKNYVEGDENCNYEKYLLEIVNASEMFRLLSGGKEYTAPDNEAHGENDANSEEYSLDFKLVESSSYLEAYKQYSTGIEVVVPGVKMICESGKRGSVLVTKLHCALRDIKTFAQIENILNSESKYVPMDTRTIDNIDEQIPVDIKTFFKVLHKNKNLLLFIPEEFSFDGEGYELSEAIEIIKDALSVDYLLSLEYRKTKIAEKDTFLMCVYDKQFLLYKYENGGLVIKEVVPQIKSRTYTRLYCDYDSGY